MMKFQGSQKQFPYSMAQIVLKFAIYNAEVSTNLPKIVILKG